MAKTYLATQGDITTVQNQITNIDNSINDTGGIDERISSTETEVTNVQNTIGADDTSGLRKRIADNETAIGDETSGLTKQVADLESTVGTDNTSGLQKRMVDIETAVGTDDTTGLRQKLSEVSYDSDTNRFQQTEEPTATASDNKDLLTKKDGDELYGNQAAITASAGGYNNDTASDTWNEICAVGNISIEARHPSTGTSVARILNSTGSTVVAIHESNDEGTLSNDSTNISNGNAHEVEPSSTANSGIKTFRAGIYTSPGVNDEAYTVEIYMRNTSAGIRIACSIVALF